MSRSNSHATEVWPSYCAFDMVWSELNVTARRRAVRRIRRCVRAIGSCVHAMRPRTLYNIMSVTWCWQCRYVCLLYT